MHEFFDNLIKKYIQEPVLKRIEANDILEKMYISYNELLETEEIMSQINPAIVPRISEVKQLITNCINAIELTHEVPKNFLEQSEIIQKKLHNILSQIQEFS